jgi:hypothetical protein
VQPVTNCAKQSKLRYGVLQLIPVVARSKAGVCGPSLAGNAGSNPTGGMDVCPFLVLCVFS